jgi:hypothetical protein
MGSSISKNVVNFVSDIITTTTNEVLLKQEVNNNQSLIIRIHDTEGDVNIHDNVFEQRATVSIKALQTTLLNTEINQKIDQQIAQAAKSVISGINLLQFSNAENTIDNLIKACIEIKNTTLQTCLSSTNQNINIIVEYTKGNVNISNIKTKQMAVVFNECVQNATNSNKTIQDVITKLDQAASATSEGFSLWAIAGIIIGIVLIGGGSFAIGVTAVTKIVFPATLIASCISGVLYFTLTTNPTILSYGYVDKLLSENSNCEVSSKATESVATSTLASEKCLNGNFSAYEWNNGKAIFYDQKIGQACINSYTYENKDKTPLISNLVYKKGEHDTLDSDQINTLRLNTSNNKLWFYDNSKQWKEIGTFSNTINWDNIDPSGKGSEGNLFINYEKNKLFKYDGTKWIEQCNSNNNDKDCKIMQNIPTNSINSNVEKSKFVGFKRDGLRKKWLLYLAIGLFVVGVIGIVLTNKPKTKPTT